MTEAIGFSPAGFAFLDDLSRNNNRDWFASNKAVFERCLETPFVRLLEALSNRLSDMDRPLSGGAATVFRMNRDIRFSADKRPYKTNLSGILTPSGTKREAGGLVYLHLDSSGGFAAAGFYNLSPAELGPIRDAMVETPEGFDLVKESLAKAGRDLDRTDSLTSMPKGFSQHSEHRHAAEIRLKSLMVRQPLPKESWLAGDVADHVEKLARDAAALLAFAGRRA
jgi:uncharacterized protein (TIGR02453 family)